MQAAGLVVRRDGTMVVAATARRAGDLPWSAQLVFAFVQSDGSLDAAVGDGGVERLDVTGLGTVGGVAGGPSNGTYAIIDRSMGYMMPNEWGVLRVDAAGKADPKFAAGALSIVTLCLTRDVYTERMSIAPLPDGGALVGRIVEGVSGAPAPAFVMARFKADGALDARALKGGIADA